MLQNWFQNRRAKAKQERKQEEYEARRAAEKSGSEPGSPENPPSVMSEFSDQNTDQQMKPSSALFPELSQSVEQCHSMDNDSHYEEDGTCKSESFDSPYEPQAVESHQDDPSSTADLHSPLSLDFSHSDRMGFVYPPANQGFHPQGSVHGYSSFALQHRNSSEHLEHQKGLDMVTHALPSPEEQMPNAGYQADQYFKAIGVGYPSSALPFFNQTSIMEEKELEGIKDEGCLPHDGESDGSLHDEPMTPSTHQDFSAPGDSFKSPPPPANIATRRKIQRPAALQVTKSSNLGGGPKTAMDGPRRCDASSPATAMRRIASASGNMAGRIQKQSAGPRSPLFLNRNAEAFLQFHSRSPASVFSAAFSGAAPPTPMTPAVFNQQGVREPTVSSNCSDDEAFSLGHGVPNHFMSEFKPESLKTPPETPGLMTSLNTQTFGGHPFSAPIDFTVDRPLMTPYFHSEFPDLSLSNSVPSYVEMGDNSLPATPLYPNLINSARDPNIFISSGSTQYDWDTNESITSSKSSPEQPRSKQIQFTQNITPQDYHPGDMPARTTG